MNVLSELKRIADEQRDWSAEDRLLVARIGQRYTSLLAIQASGLLSKEEADAEMGEIRAQALNCASAASSSGSQILIRWVNECLAGWLIKVLA